MYHPSFALKVSPIYSFSQYSQMISLIKSFVIARIIVAAKDLIDSSQDLISKATVGNFTSIL